MRSNSVTFSEQTCFKHLLSLLKLCLLPGSKLLWSQLLQGQSWHMWGIGSFEFDLCSTSVASYRYRLDRTDRLLQCFACVSCSCGLFLPDNPLEAVMQRMTEEQSWQSLD